MNSLFFFYGYGDHRALHVLTHSFPTLRSSDLNEPLELVRRLLCGTEPINPRDGELAHRGVVMIDPFPNDAVFVDPREIKDSLFQVAMQMFAALMNQEIGRAHV